LTKKQKRANSNYRTKAERNIARELRSIVLGKAKFRELWLIADMTENRLRQELRASLEKRGVDYTKVCERNRVMVHMNGKKSKQKLKQLDIRRN
jgi:hypothetical protein